MNPTLLNLITLTAPLTFVPSLGALYIAAQQGEPTAVIDAMKTALDDRKYVVGRVRAYLNLLIDDVNEWAAMDHPAAFKSTEQVRAA
jgi:hypothetical protein